MRHAEEFDACYERACGRLVGEMYAITGDLSEAEDVVQEAFCRAAARWGRIRSYGQPEAWVRRVALHLVVDHGRWLSRRMTALRRLGPPRSVPDLSPDGMVLLQALRRLPLSQRQVLLLHDAFDVPVQEVATQLAVPVGTVKSRLSRGRAALAAQLTDHSIEGERLG